MIAKIGFQNESIAYALAAGLVVFESTDAVDRDCERARRRARHDRNNLPKVSAR